MNWNAEVVIIILLILCIGGIGERYAKRRSIFGASSSHGLRHSAKRHMLAHAETFENSSFIDTTNHNTEPLSPLPLIQSSASLRGHSNHTSASTTEGVSEGCHIDAPCHMLAGNCIACVYNYSCVYGEDTKITCEALKFAKCQGNRTFIKTHNCLYCYQMPSKEHHCQRNTSCHVVSAPRNMYITKCTVKSHILCLGNRVFHKQVPCNWTKGYSWTTALLLSIVFGGFGVDRFYLGMWQEGIGKLFSFGGLGVWTLVDVILIATGYLGPADHSLYIRP